ncbi:hypothetical protein AURDEDRAFT_117335 [Auricularia subglabra TFB-10046 SS5]|uniref:DUF6534 domain-containing protein n=1 Tax=Auricularia subglabra (strain TFB-10046 / SS5) TaxID=717982 RepID=J0D8K8_AURST|nr:hypothetical protein AURDEDRAFT_117335 [Auricularia subglabra TFB-10046 SS5]
MVSRATTSRTAVLAHLIKERTGVEHLDAALRLVMRVTIESAAPCLICVFLTIVMFYTTFKTSNLTMFFIITTGKFYCHALLLTLNS